MFVFLCYKQKTAYEMRISDWSSDVCSSDLVTVFFGYSGGFSESTAQPLALAVMTGAGMGAPSVISRMRELSGQRPALELDDEEPLTGRPLTVNVVAEDGREGRLVRATIIEFGLMDTGQWMNRYRY